MFTTKARKLAAMLGLAIVGLAVAVPAAQAGEAHQTRAAAATYLFSPGQKLWVVYNDSPLRVCPGEDCGIIVYMPATTSLNPGGGWVTSLVYQNADNAWCLIDWRNIDGWTGCWRLAVPV